MSREGSRNTSMNVLLTVLGVAAVALTAGILLFQKQESPDGSINIASALSLNGTEQVPDNFDPVSWARQGAAYPPLYETENPPDNFTADFNTPDAVQPAASDSSLSAQQPEKAPAAVVVQPADPPKENPPAVKTPAPKKEVKKTYREVQENAYWVQVFSSDNPSRAEDIRTELAEKGFPANVIAREVDGTTWYRVRIGGFSQKAEAEHYAGKLRAMDGFESSWVVQAPVTRRIASDS
ncbi:MAG: hypothetical protein CSA76_02140 [Spirochaetales bacterium]|nr:MAG: hypothetical protein CSA76_02140 [Spirochaetales bacterium]